MAGEAGKGSALRPTQVPQEVADANWDQIFGKKTVVVDIPLESTDPNSKQAMGRMTTYALRSHTAFGRGSSK